MKPNMMVRLQRDLGGGVNVEGEKIHEEPQAKVARVQGLARICGGGVE